ncbi:MAG: DUF4384 domain-containing protein [Desulfobacteraceae bacterium]|nr:MAG: DUF4384 domain-containing protein [Desulfobacteraceae bacterium]
MKYLSGEIIQLKWIRSVLFTIPVLLVLISCASVDPRQVDVEIKEEPPEVKITSFTEALTQLGKMTEIYATEELRVQSKDIADNTGTSGATGGEIPRDVTEMLQSTLNSIGGKVRFIPYNPAFIQNQMVTGYSTFENKMIPDVVITGGITEFDRGLETRGSNVDAGIAADFTHAPSWAPSNSVAADYGSGEKYGLASITLDFNMIDFQSMAGIAKMQTVNSMKVSKAVSEKELAITLLGPTFGLKGSIKKVQGRHAAVRLLVQLSMMQIIGKYLMVPYWTLLPDVSPDPVVMDALKKAYFAMDEVDRIIKVQEFLFIQGYDVSITGELDQATLSALQKVKPGANTIDRDTYLAVFLSIPINDDTYERRMELNKAYAALAREPEIAPEPVVTPQPAPKKVTKSAPEPAQEPQEVASAPPAPKTEKKAPAETKTSSAEEEKRRSALKDGLGGRMLSEDEW